MGRDIIINVEVEWHLLNYCLILEQSIAENSILQKFKTFFWLAVGTIWEDATKIGIEDIGGVE